MDASTTRYLSLMSAVVVDSLLVYALNDDDNVWFCSCTIVVLFVGIMDCTSRDNHASIDLTDHTIARSVNRFALLVEYTAHHLSVWRKVLALTM